jgi:hypothetical protein
MQILQKEGSFEEKEEKLHYNNFIYSFNTEIRTILRI